MIICSSCGNIIKEEKPYLSKGYIWNNDSKDFDYDPIYYCKSCVEIFDEDVKEFDNALNLKED